MLRSLILLLPTAFFTVGFAGSVLAQGPLPPSITKNFVPGAVLVGGNSVLIFTITNSGPTTLTGVGFSDLLPAGLVVSTPNGLTGSCGGGTITATGGGISLAGATLPLFGGCTFTVNVTATSAGTKVNITSPVTSNEAGSGNSATATLFVFAPIAPAISKSFSISPIPVGGTTALSFTVINPNGFPLPATLTGVSFSDILPAGLVVSTPNGLTGTCGGGTIAAAAGSGSINLSGATLPPGASSCTFSVSVTATSPGTKNNATSPVTSNETGPGNSATATLLVFQGATTTALSSSQNPSGFGQAVTFTAAVTPVFAGPVTPTGTVTFRDGATVLGTVPVNGSGQATLTTSALAVGSHPITAAYSGDTNFTTSGAALTQTVGQGSTSTALSSSQNPSTFGQSVTFTATVTGGAGTPTGTVTFRDGATVLGTVALNGSGQATFTTSSLAIGTHPITATYSGDANFTGSTSATLNQAVNQAGTATTLSSSQNPSTFGQPVTFTATVTASGAPTGTVTFTDGGTVLGTVAINGSGVATLTTSSLSPGSHSIVATYSGDATFQTSTSPVLNQVVNQAATTTALASSKNPSEFGQPVTFTATVTSSGGTPAGTVTFKDGATVLGTATLNGAGQASFTTSSLSVGSHPVTASYNGSASFAASTSAVVVQAVNVPADSVKLRALQIAVTKIEANNSGQAISGVIDSAIAEGFSGGGELITPSGTGVRFNFSAEPREMDPATGSVADRAGDAFAALGYAPRKQAVFKAPPPRSLVQPPREWLAWADVRGTGWSTDTSKSDIRGGQVNALLGITRNVTPDFILGAFGGYENFSYTSELLSGRLKGDGWTAGGYLGWRLIPGMRFDAAIARSGLTYNAVAGTASASIPGSRWLGSVGLTGTSKMQDWEIEPSARVYALWEREAAFTDSLGTQQTERNFSTGRASAGAKATYFTAWSDSVRLTPYLGLYGDYYFSKDDAVIALLDPPAYTLSGWSARLVSGVGVDLADGKKLSIDGEIGGLGGDHRMWTLRGRVAVPF